MKPVALIGAGAKISGAVSDLRGLLDHLNIPTIATVHGLGAVPPEAPYYLGMVGMHGTRASNTALHETDLLLIFGARLDDRVTGDPTRFAPDAKIVHFEIDPAQLDRVRACELPVIGDLADTIPAFHREVKAASLPDWSEWRAIAGGRSVQNSILEDYLNRRFVFWMSFLAACRKTALWSPTWVSIRCGRRSVIARRFRVASSPQGTRFDGLCIASSHRRADGEAGCSGRLCLR